MLSFPIWGIILILITSNLMQPHMLSHYLLTLPRAYFLCLIQYFIHQMTNDYSDLNISDASSSVVPGRNVQASVDLAERAEETEVSEVSTSPWAVHLFSLSLLTWSSKDCWWTWVPRNLLLYQTLFLPYLPVSSEKLQVGWMESGWARME